MGCPAAIDPNCVAQLYAVTADVGGEVAALVGLLQDRQATARDIGQDDEVLGP